MISTSRYKFKNRDIPVNCARPAFLSRYGLILIALSLSISMPAYANRKSQTIRNLILEKRHDEAQEKCERWGASTAKSDTDLREVCAQAFWDSAMRDDKVSSWQNYQTKWEGTTWQEKAFWREGKAQLRELGDIAGEADYLAVAEKFDGTEHAETAMSLAASAAIRTVDSPEIALYLAEKYAGHPSLPTLVERFPEAFIQFEIVGRSARAYIEPPVAYDLPEPMWMGRQATGALMPWEKAVKDHLKATGVSDMVAMRAFRAGKESGPGLPLCPLPDAPVGFTVGVAVSLGERYAFKEVPYDPSCVSAYPAIMSFENGKFKSISLAPQHLIKVPQNESKRQSSFDFVRPIGDVSFVDNKLYRATGKTYAVAPLNGAPGWLTDKPPGNFRVLIHELRGTGPTKGWGIKPSGKSLRITNPQNLDWTMPNSELRFLSPLASYTIGLQGVIISPAAKPVPMSNGTPPPGVTKLRVTKIGEQDLLAAGLQLASAGLKTAEVELADGWEVDLDNDGYAERFLRGKYQSTEVVFVLDQDEKNGKRTYVYETKHAMNGGSPAPQPKAIISSASRSLFWSGTEAGTQYAVQVFVDRGGYNIHRQ